MEREKVLLQIEREGEIEKVLIQRERGREI